MQLLAFIQLLLLWAAPQKPKRILHKQLWGEWSVEKKAAEGNRYTRITFMRDSTCVVDCSCDTIFRYRYKVLSDTVVLKDKYNRTEYGYIKKLNDKKLVFTNFKDNTRKPAYFKSAEPMPDPKQKRPYR